MQVYAFAFLQKTFLMRKGWYCDKIYTKIYTYTYRKYACINIMINYDNLQY